MFPLIKFYTCLHTITPCLPWLVFSMQSSYMCNPCLPNMNQPYILHAQSTSTAKCHTNSHCFSSCLTVIKHTSICSVSSAMSHYQCHQLPITNYLHSGVLRNLTQYYSAALVCRADAKSGFVHLYK